jgi:pimeloyl-[acyl-carrier protein] methyl ester esterase
MKIPKILPTAALLITIVQPAAAETKPKTTGAKIAAMTSFKVPRPVITETMIDAKHFTVKTIAASSVPDTPGYDVILIPGLASPREVWDETAAQLDGQYRLHIVQIRGFGDDAGINVNGPILEPFVTELAGYIDREIIKNGRGKPAIVGHSMGGLSAAMIAARYPDYPSKILIVDSLPFIGLLFGPNMTVEKIEPQAAAAREWGMAAGKQPANESMLQTQSATPEGRAQVAKWSGTADYRTTMHAFYDVMTTDIRPELAKIKVPATMLYPHDKAVGPVEKVNALYTNAYQGLAGINLILIDNSRHFIMLDQPQLFAEAIDAFLTTQP